MCYHTHNLSNAIDALPTYQHFPSLLLSSDAPARADPRAFCPDQRQRSACGPCLGLTHCLCPGCRAPTAGMGSGPTGGGGRGGSEAGRAAQQCPAAAGGRDDGQAGVPAQGREPAGDWPLPLSHSSGPCSPRTVHKPVPSPASLPVRILPFVVL